MKLKLDPLLPLLQLLLELLAVARLTATHVPRIYHVSRVSHATPMESAAVRKNFLLVMVPGTTPTHTVIGTDITGDKFDLVEAHFWDAKLKLSNS